MAAYISIRIGRLPGRIQELALNGDRTVATALATAGLDASGYEIRVQGAPATATTSLNEGDIVLLVKKIKGNGLFSKIFGAGVVGVSVGRVPGGKPETVALDEPRVFAALQAAGITLGSGEVVYINDRLGSVGEPVEDGDVVVVKAAATAPSPEPETDEVVDDLVVRAEVIAAQAETAQWVVNALRAFREARAALEAEVAAYDGGGGSEVRPIILPK